MSEKLSLVGNEYFSNIFEESVKNAKNNKGSIILLSGESGFGKTHILGYFHDEYKHGTLGIKSVFTEGQAPIGKFNVGNIQPLYPFSKAIEHFLEQTDVTPEKRFAKNVGLTMLASMPLLGEVFYAVKEIGRDYRQFKSEKSSEKAKKVSSATADYYDTLLSFADKTPFIIFMDDMHWADSQSIELISLLSENIKGFPIVIVIAYKQSILEHQGLPLMSFIMNIQEHPDVKSIALDSLSREQINELTSKYFKNYKRNDEFEDWILEHSYGIPGVAAEYLGYFQKHPPFSPDGTLATNFKGNEFLPSTVQTVFTQHLDSLSEEERNILAICSAEGREFTALVVSQLMNTDILTAIKKLKQLQIKTNIIKSIGAEKRYGVKTTVFKFTQAFYHTYFESSLEYEEYTTLHGQIAAFLKSKFEQTDNELLREDLAPYLAAHSIESGDEETAKSMLLLSARQADKYGSKDVVKVAFDKFSEIKNSMESDGLDNAEFMHMLGSALNNESKQEKSDSGDSDNNPSQFDASILDYKLYVKSIINDILTGRFENGSNKVMNVFNKMESILSQIEKTVLLCLAVKCYSEVHNTEKAEETLKTISDLLKIESTEQIECLYYNTASSYYFAVGNLPKSYFYLDKSANLVAKLPQELRLLTIVNIALTTKDSTPEKSVEYMRAAKKLSTSLSFEKLYKDLIN